MTNRARLEFSVCLIVLVLLGVVIYANVPGRAAISEQVFVDASNIKVIEIDAGLFNVELIADDHEQIMTMVTGELSTRLKDRFVFEVVPEEHVLKISAKISKYMTGLQLSKGHDLCLKVSVPKKVLHQITTVTTSGSEVSL